MVTGKHIIVYYHGDCIDGFAAAFCLWLIYKDKADYIPIYYDSHILHKEYYINKKVFILDYTFSKEDMENLIKYCKKFIWIDHHQSSIEMLKEFDIFTIDNQDYFKYKNHKFDLIIDVNKSAALVTYNYFHGEDKNNLFTYIDDYDRYILKYEESKYLNLYLNTLIPYEFKEFEHLLTDDLTKYIEEGKILEKKLKSDIFKTLKNKTRCRVLIENDNKYITGLAINTNLNLNAISDILAKESNTFCLIWRMNRDCKIYCSFKSLNGFNTLVIAKNLGGGGHKNSSGVTLSLEDFLDHIKLITEYRKL